MQLKDGEESEASGVTFTVELRARMVRVNGAEQQRCTAPCSGGPWLAWRGIMSVGHGGCDTCHVAQVSYKSR